MRPDMVTSTGKLIYFEDPSKTSLDLEDFRIPLANICRYNGHAQWTLLQHLALCVLLVPLWYGEASPGMRAEYRAALALHDLHEVFVGDMVTGLKRHCPEFVCVEWEWATHVAKELGLGSSLEEPLCQRVVKFIDHRALMVEMDWLKHGGFEWVSENCTPTTSGERAIVQFVAAASPSYLWDLVSAALQFQPFPGIDE